jgi:hypothetical protein
MTEHTPIRISCTSGVEILEFVRAMEDNRIPWEGNQPFPLSRFEKWVRDKGEGPAQILMVVHPPIGTRGVRWGSSIFYNGDVSYLTPLEFYSTILHPNDY